MLTKSPGFRSLSFVLLFSCFSEIRMAGRGKGKSPAVLGDFIALGEVNNKPFFFVLSAESL